MKIIITESQFNMVIPTPLRRRLDGLEDLMYDIFPDTLNKEIPTYEHLLIYFLGDKIREFWKKNQ